MTDKNHFWLLLVTLLFFVHFVQTKDVFAQYTDVSPGMSIEDALFVARNCVVQASSFKDPRKNKKKELRPQDTLGFAGITDASRLNAMRRYIVGNRQIGVQSIWAVKKGGQIAQSFLIARTALDKVTSETTIQGLADIISKNAGLPFLTFQKVSQIVSNCRKANDNLSVNTAIQSDLAAIGLNAGDFRDCLFKTTKTGKIYVYDKKVGITDPDGDIYYYSYDDLAQINQIIGSGNYDSLIKEISNKARINFSPYLTAVSLVINSIRLSKVDCNRPSFRISEPCPGTTLKITSTLSGLVISVAEFKSNLNPGAGIKFRKTSKSESANLPDFTGLDIKADAPVWKLIEIVRKELEK